MCCNCSLASTPYAENGLRKKKTDIVVTKGVKGYNGFHFFTT